MDSLQMGKLNRRYFLQKKNSLKFMYLKKIKEAWMASKCWNSITYFKWKNKIRVFLKYYAVS